MHYKLTIHVTGQDPNTETSFRLWVRFAAVFQPKTAKDDELLHVGSS